MLNKRGFSSFAAALAVIFVLVAISIALKSQTLVFENANSQQAESETRLLDIHYEQPLVIQPSENTKVPITGMATGGDEGEESYGVSALPNCTAVCGNSITSSCRLNQSLSQAGTGNCLTINVNNIVLDCAGFNIDGDDTSGSNGIYASGRTNVTIKNCNITDFQYGVYLASSSNNCTVVSNTLNSNTAYGMWLLNSHSCNVSNNRADFNAQHGLGFQTSNYDIVQSNNASNNTQHGFYLFAVDYGNFRNNRAMYNFQSGFYVSSSDFDVFDFNTANNNVISVGNYRGFDIQITTHSNFTNNVINNNKGYGIRLSLSTYNRVINNTVHQNITGTSAPILVDSNSHYNTFSNNGLYLNGWDFSIASGVTGTRFVYPLKPFDYTFSSAANIIFENPGNSKLAFLKPITGTGSNILSSVQLSPNLVYVDTATDPEFNVSANITIYNTDSLGLADRIPYRNGDACPASICTELSDANIYVFNVTHFTNYSVGETLISCGDNISSSTVLASDLTGCTGNGLEFNTNNVVLDCAGHVISGTGSNNGLMINGVDNVTIKNCNITGFMYGITLGFGSDNSKIYSNNISGNNRGIFLASSVANNNITRNNIIGNSGAGLWFSAPGTTGGLNNKIYNNNIYGSAVGAYSSTSGTIEMSYNGKGNYWGRTSCPVFIPGTDSSFAVMTDSYAYNSANGWLSGSPADCIKPSLQIVSNPSPVAQGSAKNLVVNITEQNPSKYVAYRNGVSYATGSYSSGTPFNVAINTTLPGQANYTIWANDTSGNNANINASVTVLANPTVQLVSPGSGETVFNSTVVLKFYSLSAYNSTLGYNLTINGAFNQTGTAVSGANTTITKQLGNGTYSWKVTVWDYGSNSKTSATNSFNVLIKIPIDPVVVPPIASTTASSGVINLASEGVPSEVIASTGVTGYEYVVTTNGTTPQISLSVEIFLEPGVAGTSDLSGTAGAIPGFYYTISVNDSSWYNNVSNIQLRIYYDISNLSIPAGYTEDRLRAVRYTSGSWVKLDCDSLSCTAALADGTLLYASGADTTSKYVWANLSRFSTYGVSGTTAPSAVSVSSGSGGRSCEDLCIEGDFMCWDGSYYICRKDFDGDSCSEWGIEDCPEGEECNRRKEVCEIPPCVEDWVCTEWSECLIGRQTRTCEDWNKCGKSAMKPVTAKECGVKIREAVPVRIAPPSEEKPAAPKSNGLAVGFAVILAMVIAFIVFETFFKGKAAQNAGKAASGLSAKREAKKPAQKSAGKKARKKR